jgi:G3E family GTPase
MAEISNVILLLVLTKIDLVKEEELSSLVKSMQSLLQPN